MFLFNWLTILDQFQGMLKFINVFQKEPLCIAAAGIFTDNSFLSDLYKSQVRQAGP